MVQLSHPYTTTGKTIALTRWTFIGKVMSLLFDLLSRFVIAFHGDSFDEHITISIRSNIKVTLGIQRISDIK